MDTRILRRTLPIIIPLFISSCSSSSDDTGSDSENLDIPDTDPTMGPPIVAADVLPFETSEGAESDFRGCLNRPLYFNGPHFVFTAYDVTSLSDFNGNVDNYSENIERFFTVIEVNEEGVSTVDVETTLTRSDGLGGTFNEPRTLDGYSLRILGQSSDNPDPMPFQQNFDLQAGESVTQDVIELNGNNPVPTTESYTYVGREQISIAGQMVDACRVESTTTVPADEDPITGIRTEWYGVGTGILLRRDSQVAPNSEIDRITINTVLTNASVNSIQLF